MFKPKIDNLTPRWLLYYHLTYELEVPMIVVCEVMQVKKSQYYNIKNEVDEEMEKQKRRYLISIYKK
jgi:hypothetical protein